MAARSVETPYADELDGTATGGMFLKTYFPELLELSECLASMKQMLAEMGDQKQRFTIWCQQAGALEGEHRRLRAG